jgi:hypothetical protein
MEYTPPQAPPIVEKCPPVAPPVSVFDLSGTIVIEAEIPRRPVTFYFTPDGIQSNCPGGVCPTPQANPVRRRFFK